MKLYDDARAPSPRRVRMFAAEKGLDIPRIAVDIAGGGTQAEDFLRINPLGEVPDFGTGAKWDRVPPPVPGRAPSLGADTEAVLAQARESARRGG